MRSERSSGPSVRRSTLIPTWRGDRQMTAVDIGEIDLGIESFGDEKAPLVLLAGAPTMLSWPDQLCEQLAAGGCRVVRYDLRDSGESTTEDPAAPSYTLRDLAGDAAALVDVLGGVPAHLAGIGVGGLRPDRATPTSSITTGSRWRASLGCGFPIGTTARRWRSSAPLGRNAIASRRRRHRGGGSPEVCPRRSGRTGSRHRRPPGRSRCRPVTGRRRGARRRERSCNRDR
ncbi:alpha/beta hydrolase [Rhodococcus coprophilus]|uniref:Alpha/beta hydrolase n=1 Tax=Rhodococcus coprophilus TaxID=38310 RepID=A0A2X4TQ17_9NOCA|nr:alpha/beta hydrolase [Rhodococcus coprophilus]